jgi:hypothetical protein
LPNIFGVINYVGVDENEHPTAYCFMHLNKEFVNSLFILLPLYGNKGRGMDKITHRNQHRIFRCSGRLESGSSL